MNQIDVTKLPLYLPLKNFHDEHKKTKETCSICTDEFDLTITPVDNIKDLAITKCAHVFHTACLQGWLNGHDNCPNCREAGITSSITKTSNDGRLIFNDLLTKKEEPKNDRKRKIEETEDLPAKKASNFEIVKFLADSDLLKSEKVLLSKPDAANFLMQQKPGGAYVVRWSKTFNQVIATIRTGIGCLDDLLDGYGHDLNKLFADNKNLVIPQSYIDAYNAAHSVNKRSKTEQLESNFEIMKFHMEVPSEFKLTMNQENVEKIVSNYPLNTKVFYIDDRTSLPMIAVQKDGATSITVLTLAEELGDLSLKEYLEKNIIIIPKQYRDDYNRIQFHTQSKQPKPEEKSDEEIAKELAKFYENIDSGYESDERLAREMQQGGLTQEQIAQIQQDEILARQIAREQR